MSCTPGEPLLLVGKKIVNSCMRAYVQALLPSPVTVPRFFKESDRP